MSVFDKLANCEKQKELEKFIQTQREQERIKLIKTIAALLEIALKDDIEKYCTPEILAEYLINNGCAIYTLNNVYDITTYRNQAEE